MFFHLKKIFGHIFEANFGDPCDYHKSVEKFFMTPSS